MVDKEQSENNRQTGLREFEESEQEHGGIEEKPDGHTAEEASVDSEMDDVETDEQVGSEKSDQEPAPSSSSDLSDLPTTESGSVKKVDAMEWLSMLDEPSNAELNESFVPKPRGFTGSTFPTSISTIRITGDPVFVECVAGLLKPALDLEAENTRLEIALQQVVDRETDELTDNYAMYLSVAERGA